MKKKLDGIQVLRGIAAIIILMYHAWALSIKLLNYNYLNGLFQDGYLGVDLFFVISGFIIFFIYKKGFVNLGKIKLFLLKRFTRIYPFYWFLNLLIIPLYFLFPQYKAGYETNPIIILTSLLLIPYVDGPIIYVAWTLWYIIFFYIWFAVLFAVKKSWRKWVLGVWSILNIYVFLVPYFHFSFPENPLIRFIFNEYNIEFLLGISVAYFLSKKLFPFRNILLIVGIISLIAGSLITQKWNSYRVLTYGIPLSLIIFSVALSDIPFLRQFVPNKSGSKWLRRVYTRSPAQRGEGYIYTERKMHRLLVYLGNASYSIFLSHYMTLAILTRLFLLTGFQSFISPFIAMSVFCIIAVMIGCVLYSFVEKPMLFYLQSKVRNIS
jgi:peptidoglycan/LPS O-acetylase OafA/YrhL